MPKRSSLGINFDSLGIGDALNQYTLAVPVNQRPYAWEAEHVQTLLEDFAGAMASPDSTYFLGTIVLTHGKDGRVEVADGQQRLATASMLIAAIRDRLSEGDKSQYRAASKYTEKYLMEYDENEGDYIPKLKLSDRDNDFFCKRVLLWPDDENRDKTTLRYIARNHIASHSRIAEAQEIIKKFVQDIITPYAEREKPKELYRWINFVTKSAIVIVIEVPDHINAYTMFETLNDRGLRASQADILKNFLFGMAERRLGELQNKWAAMVSTIENIGDDDDVLKHIRHSWIAKNGPTVERELASRVKDSIGNMQQAIEVVSYFEGAASNYVALITPLGHPAWSDFGPSTKYHIYAITNILKIEQIRPLMLAISFHFNNEEIKRAFKLLLSLSVRFLIFGVSGSGGLEKNYGTIAKEISAGLITTHDQIIPKMTVTVPSDKAFEESFKTARASRAPLARYYLRAIETYRSGLSNPEYGGVDEPTVYNLEHVLPITPSDQWDIDQEVAREYQKRLGNMVLLNPSQNTDIGNGSYEEKRTAFSGSTLITTQEVARYLNWGPDEIEARQQELANVVSKIWPLEIK